jgi:hypothetical protein
MAAIRARAEGFVGEMLAQMALEPDAWLRDGRAAHCGHGGHDGTAAINRVEPCAPVRRRSRRVTWKAQLQVDDSTAMPSALAGILACMHGSAVSAAGGIRQ